MRGHDSLRAVEAPGRHRRVSSRKRIGLSPSLVLVARIFERLLRLATHDRGVALAAHLAPASFGEVLAPLPQHGLVDVEPPAVSAFRLDDQVHMWVSLMRVERHDVLMLASEVLAGEGLRRRKHRLRRRRAGHRKHDVVRQFRSRRACPLSLPLRYCPGESSRCQLLRNSFWPSLVDSLSVIGLEVDLALLADVGEVRGDGADPPSPAGYFTMTSGACPSRCARMCSICGGREAVRLRGTGPPTAEEVKERGPRTANATGT